jgi:hypothetical protein
MLLRIDAPHFFKTDGICLGFSLFTQVSQQRLLFFSVLSDSVIPFVQTSRWGTPLKEKTKKALCTELQNGTMKINELPKMELA